MAACPAWARRSARASTFWRQPGASSMTPSTTLRRLRGTPGGCLDGGGRCLLACGTEYHCARAFSPPASRLPVHWQPAYSRQDEGSGAAGDATTAPVPPLPHPLPEQSHWIQHGH